MRLPLLLSALPLLAVAGALCARDVLRTDSTRTASATYYHARSGQGTCTLPPQAPWDSFYVSVGRTEFARSLACGACMVVHHGADSVVVRVTDRCQGCRKGKIDLSRAAFRKLASLGTGRIQVRWRFAACPDSSLALRRTDGSSGFWSSLQAWGLPWPVESLSVAGPDGNWQSFRRERHNHFTRRNLSSLPWTLRTVDLFGRVRIDSAVDLAPGDTLWLDETESDSAGVDSIPPAPTSILPAP